MIEGHILHPLRTIEHGAQGLKEFTAPPAKAIVDIYQYFLSEPVAPKASRTDLHHVPLAPEIEIRGTFIGNPDDKPEDPTGIASVTDSTDKYTHDLDTCIAVVAEGYSKDDEDKVSKLIHLTQDVIRDPSYLTTEIEEFSDATINDRQSVVVAGGLSLPKRGKTGIRAVKTYEQIYKEMVSVVAEEVIGALNIQPVVVSPKRQDNFNLTHVYYETDSQQLIIVETGEIQEEEGKIFSAGAVNRFLRD